MYTSFETIPIKLFFKIYNTGDITLLGDGKNHQEAWDKIVEEFHSFNSNSQHLKNLEILKKINLNKAKYTATVYAIDHLEVRRNEKLEELLRGYRYNLTDENFEIDLALIKSQNENLRIIINTLEEEFKALSGDKENKEVKPNHLEDLITFYCYRTGMSYDSNKITGSQFVSLQKLALKIKN